MRNQYRCWNDCDGLEVGVDTLEREVTGGSPWAWVSHGIVTLDESDQPFVVQLVWTWANFNPVLEPF
jgi:hypothetical protein